MNYLKDFVSSRLNLLPSEKEEEGLQILLTALQSRFGENLVAILLYGSYLRGSRDTLIDFYVIVDNYEEAFDSRLECWGAYLMPPNVYYLSKPFSDQKLHAKYAVMSSAQIQRQVNSVHPYFWARLAQPTRLVFLRDTSDHDLLVTIVSQAIHSFLERMTPMISGVFEPSYFWKTGFNLTYRSELRAEKSSRIESMFAYDPSYYVALIELASKFGIFGQSYDDGHTKYFSVGKTSLLRARILWGWTIGIGKLLSLARLIKGAITFDGAVDYILWKIERHSGVQIEVSDRQRKYPLLFAWPLLWKLFRLRAFR